MDYREVRPAPPLRRYLECFWFLSAEDASGASPEPVLPDGCMELIVHLGEPFRRFDDAGASEVQPGAFFVGQMTRPLVIQPSRRASTMGIRFRAGGARVFLGIPMDGLANRVVPIDTLWGRAARELEEALREARSDAARIAIVEAFLLEGFVETRRDIAVEEAVRAILAKRGRGRIDALPPRVGLGSRQLERRFLAAIGLSPKVFSRIVRFQNLVRIAPGADGWASAAAECGYFDQAHLVRDVRNFAAVSPSNLLRRPGDFSRHFVSEERLAALFDVGFVQDSPPKRAQIGAEGDT
ncbi:MAG: helix-turn-helix domain-containing protein [Acidobacteriota bacterium]